RSARIRPGLGDRPAHWHDRPVQFDGLRALQRHSPPCRRLKTTLRMKLSRLLLFLSGLSSLPVSAFEPFQVKDIRVEGIQRTEPGTIFTYLPVRVGDTLTDEKAAAAIRSLYATGFFKDVRLEAENGVLVVVVEERPAIDQITFVGQK